MFVTSELYLASVFFNFITLGMYIHTNLQTLLTMYWYASLLHYWILALELK